MTDSASPGTAIPGFDHAIVGVEDLEAARRVWTRLGFTLCPRGRHIGWGTANYCVMFEHVYIELLGIVDPEQFTNNLDQRLAERGEGLLGMALAGRDPAVTHAALEHAGAEPPRDLKRVLELPGGDVTPEFNLVHLPATAAPGMSTFVCHHLTPELMRRPEWLRRSNGATGLVSAVVEVADPGADAWAYGTTFGVEAVDGTTIRLGRHEVHLRAGARGLAALTVAVADLSEAAERLDAEQVPYEEVLDVGLRVAAEDATGVDLVLQA